MTNNKIDKYSPTWLAVASWADKRIEATRNELERDQDELSTVALRGEIKALRALKKLVEPETLMGVEAKSFED